jgi:uncharacterized membrane protein (UPF0127 family)
MFLKLDTKNKILLAIFTLLIFSILTSQSFAVELHTNNSTIVNSEDFYPQYQKTSTFINGYNVVLAIASTQEQKVKGLSGLEKLNENEGMLFLFDEPSKQGFWMNEMNIPIDIIWLSSESKVVHIEKRLQPCKMFIACPVYSPQVDSLYVIELKSGFSDDHSIKKSMMINFSLAGKN